MSANLNQLDLEYLNFNKDITLGSSSTLMITNTNTNTKTNQSTQSNTSVSMSQEWKNNDMHNELVEIYTKIPASQFVNEIRMKLKIPGIHFLFEGDNEYAWKCTAKCNSIFSGVGYNNSKKEAKKIASEQLVFTILNDLVYGKKLRKLILQDYINKPTDDLTHNNLKKRKRSLENKIEDIITTQLPGDHLTPTATPPALEISNCNLQILSNYCDDKHLEHPPNQTPNSNSPIAEKRNSTSNSIGNMAINIPVLTKSNLPPLIQKSEILPQIEEDLKDNKILNFNFEIFCLKLERYLIVSAELVYLVNMHMSIERVLKKKTILSIANIHPVGSYKSSTLRSNFLEVDLVVEFSKMINNDEIYEQCFEALYEEFKQDYCIDFKESSNDNCKFIHIQNNNCTNRKRCAFNIFFIGNNASSTNLAMQHQRWIAKTKFTVEQEITLKFLKSWRRSRSLNCLNSEIIEYVIGQIPRFSVHEIIYSFFLFFSLEMFKDQKFFSQEYQKEMMMNLKSQSMEKIIEESKLAMVLIKELKFADMFI